MNKAKKHLKRSVYSQVDEYNKQIKILTEKYNRVIGYEQMEDYFLEENIDKIESKLKVSSQKWTVFTNHPQTKYVKLPKFVFALPFTMVTGPIVFGGLSAIQGLPPALSITFSVLCVASGCGSIAGIFIACTPTYQEHYAKKQRTKHVLIPQEMINDMKTTLSYRQNGTSFSDELAKKINDLEVKKQSKLKALRGFNNKFPSLEAVVQER